MKTEQKSVSFKFTWVIPHDMASGKLRETGLVNRQQLVLGKARFSQSHITDAVLSEEQLTISIEQPDKEVPEVLFIKIYEKKAEQVKRFIDYSLSRRNVKQMLEQLSRETGEILVREMVCPRCDAAILLEGQSTPQYYCKYCDTIVTEIDTQEIQLVEQEYRLCDRCQMYSRPQKFTSFYFYFVFYFGGVHHKAVHCCPGCFRKSAWMMLFGNLPFLLGIPVAIHQLHRCYYGAIRKGPFRGLHEANALLKRGHVQPALDQYEKILDRHPLSAGVKYNIAIGLLEQGDESHAIQMFELALEDCQNYYPAQVKILETLIANGKNNRALELGRHFRMDETTMAELMLVHQENSNPHENSISIKLDESELT